MGIIEIDMKNQLFTHHSSLTPDNLEWYEANEKYLRNALDVIRGLLTSQHPKENIHFNPPHHSSLALSKVCKAFELSDFERNLLLLCAGMELDGNWGDLCAKGGNSVQSYPTFNLALKVLPQGHWSAFLPTGNLRKWQLIHIGPGAVVNLSPLQIDERILHYLVGHDHLDQRLRGIVKPLEAQIEIQVPSHLQIAEQLANTWSRSQQTSEGLPAVQLCGDEVASKRAIASHACQMLNINLHIMSAAAISALRNSEIDDVLRLWERESILTNSALLLDCDELDATDITKESAIARLIDNIPSPLIISSLDRRRSLERPVINIEVHKPSTVEQRAIWHNALGEVASSLNGHVETLVSHFSLNATTIYTVCTEAKGKGGIGENTALSTLLWDTCRSQSRPRLDELAQPIELGSSWDDLVLPEAQRQVLRDIAAHVRQRAKVYEKWGFGNKGGRGLGISALFAGASGTGKTMAAEVIADELRLDLYRIDLSQVVSKYIGETEKNLRRVFDAAETGGAILLFDEADALFGKRSDVKDSHDRHANIEVGYLLQRMEAYRGLAILTTNLKSSLDQAFMRRIRFIVQFPFPDVNQREEIWQRIFPRQTPTAGLDAGLLARLNVSGGNIRNIALNAAFLAADAGEPVEMKHILQAAKSEYAKLERPLTDAEVRDWV